MPRSQVIDPASVATHGHKGTTTSELQRPVMARAEAGVAINATKTRRGRKRCIIGNDEPARAAFVNRIN